MKKNIILTGASRGLGLEIAKILLRNDNSLFVVNRSVSDELAALSEKYSDRVTMIQYDLENIDDIPVIFKEQIGFQTPIHGFVNNAAAAYDDIVTNLNMRDLTNMYRVNVFAPFHMVKYTIRQMLLHNIRGSIVHISSISAHTGYKGLAMYASTKGALEAFSKNTAREWGVKGIRSNCVVPGFMQTSMSASLSEEQLKKIFNRTALRQETQKQSVAETVAFLLSDASNSITGQNIFVDSGTI